MPQIRIADKETLDNTKTVADQVDTKVGLNTNVAGTTTVFARLRQIYEYLTTNLSATRMALIDRLDGTITSRQASWGAVAATKTNIDNTWARVNTNLDKKISEVGGGDLIGKTMVTYSIRDVNATLFNVTGKGVARIFARRMANGAGLSLKLTVDGAVDSYFNGTNPVDINSNGGTYPTYCDDIMVPFKTSIKAELIYTAGNGVTWNVGLVYLD